MTPVVETAPEGPPVDLLTGAPYADSPSGWWSPYGGKLDRRSGVVFLPGPLHPPSPWHRDCPNCVVLGGPS